METTTGAQSLETLVNTALTDAATFNRVIRHGGPVVAPTAYDLAEDQEERSFAALYAACQKPLDLPMYWREAPLPWGRKAQIFNSANGTVVTIRRADGSTEYSRTYLNERVAHGDFTSVVCMETRIAGRAL